MNEMLGNQFFLTRNYSRAAENLEKALQQDEANKGIRRKLVVCYTQTGEVRKALDHFLQLIKQDIEFVINTDPIDDDCPCPELVYELENNKTSLQDSADQLAVLGILWLYCNFQKSYRYFEKLMDIEPANPTVKSILAILNGYKDLKNQSIQTPT